MERMSECMRGCVCVCALWGTLKCNQRAVFPSLCLFFSHLLCQPLNSLSQYLRYVAHKHETTINSQKHAIIIGYMWMYACVFVHGYVLMLHELMYDPEIKGPPTTKILVEISVGYTIHRYLCAIIICKEGRNLLKNCDRRNMSKRQSLNQSLICTLFCYFFFNFEFSLSNSFIIISNAIYVKGLILSHITVLNMKRKRHLICSKCISDETTNAYTMILFRIILPVFYMFNQLLL